MNCNLTTDISSLILKYNKLKDVKIQELIEQIEAKKRCSKKLKTWYNTKKIYYPNKINIEQTSSEITAQYKANITSGESIIDLTGGFGVDCFYFSKKIKNVVHCEINKELSKIVSHNFKQLSVTNILTIAENGIEYIQKTNEKFDFVYIDPSRRNESKGKVFLLSDCLPDITMHYKDILKKTSKILIKTSPLLDIRNAINELNHIKEIHIVAVKNEVKELLFLIEKNHSNSCKIITSNIINKKTDQFSFINEKTKIANYSLPKKYLYEPNAAILKSGGFNQVSNQFNLYKLHKHSHLYTNDNLIKFPGRSFEIIQVINYNKKNLRKLFKKTKINVSTRNFPKKVELIRKELQLLDGGEEYLIFTTDVNDNKIAIFCQKINTKKM
jgi:16S rRNA G966 N2-methylase RsmD